MSEFTEEIKMLDEVYTEVVDGIMNKPDTSDYEKSRIYFENVSSRMNHWATVLKNVKMRLEDRDPHEDLTADNRPA